MMKKPAVFYGRKKMNAIWGRGSQVADFSLKNSKWRSTWNKYWFGNVLGNMSLEDPRRNVSCFRWWVIVQTDARRMKAMPNNTDLDKRDQAHKQYLV